MNNFGLTQMMPGGSAQKMSKTSETSETYSDHAHDYDPSLLLIRLRAAAHEQQERGRIHPRRRKSVRAFWARFSFSLFFFLLFFPHQKFFSPKKKAAIWYF
jgi:hypothetical protein